RGRPAGQGAVLVLELPIQLEQLAADLVRLPPEVIEGLLLGPGQRPGTEQPADPLVGCLAAAEEVGFAVALRGGERSARPTDCLVGEAAGQAPLPARPCL